MSILELFVVLMFVGVAIFLLTQVVVPVIIGTPLFPLFRATPEIKEELKKVKQEIEQTAERFELKESVEELNRRKAQLEKK